MFSKGPEFGRFDPEHPERMEPFTISRTAYADHGGADPISSKSIGWCGCTMIARKENMSV
jgi:uncharacterized protein (UPF0303 family)